MDISKKDLEILNCSLYFLKVGELRQYLIKFGLPKEGKKAFLIEKLICFLETGEILKAKQIPEESKSKKGEVYPLHPDTLILKGAYKNDYATRDFFKKLIGPHFHFTAYGIDWINDKWLSGNSPTYQEYADMWQESYIIRQLEGPSPKEEWALIKFVLKFAEENPEASKAEAMAAWQNEREKHCKIVSDILKL